MTATDHRTPLMRSEALRRAACDRDHVGGHLSALLEAVADGSVEKCAWRRGKAVTQ